LKEKQTAMADRQKEFYSLLIPYVPQFGKKMIRAFFDHWSEPNRSKTKMKCELEATWDLPRRLSKWEDNDRKWNKSGTANSNDQRTDKAIPQTFTEEINYLIGRNEEGQSVEALIHADHYDKLQIYGFMPLGTMDRQVGATIEDKKRAAVMEFIKTNSHAQVE
jgi:hypothetical protein